MPVKAGVNGLMERMASTGSIKRPSSIHSNSSFGPMSPMGSTTSLSSTLPDDTFSNNPEDYDIRQPIGYGSSAVVYNAYYKPLNKRVAIKVIDLDMFERNQIDELRRETQVMALCKHPNVLRVNGAFVTDSKLYIVTPYLSAGSCLDIMKAAYPNGFDEISIATILKQALQGLDYLHKNGHIHRDVKAGNLLVDSDGSVLLADFGVSSSLMENGDRRGMRKTFVGTPCWMAPEVMEQAGYNYKADIWSFGITAIELATGHAPFAKYPPIKVLMLTLSNDPPTLDRETTKYRYSKMFKEMIDICLQKDPLRRPTAEKLLSHSFFKQAKKKSYLVSGLLHSLPPLEQRPPKQPAPKLEIPEKGVSWDFDGDDAEPTQDLEGEEIRRPRTVTFGPASGSAPTASVESTVAPSTPAPAPAPVPAPVQAAMPILSVDTSRTGTPTTIPAGDKPIKKSRFVVEDSSASNTASSSPIVSNLTEKMASAPRIVTDFASRNPTGQPLQGLGVSPSISGNGLPEVKKGRFSVKDTSAGSLSPGPVSIKTMPNEFVSPSRSVVSSPIDGLEGVRIGGSLEPVTPVERRSRFEVHHTSSSTPGTPTGTSSPALSAMRSTPLSRESSQSRATGDSAVSRDNSATRVSRFSIESTHTIPHPESNSTVHSSTGSSGASTSANGHPGVPGKKSRFQVSSVDSRSVGDHGPGEGPNSSNSTPTTSPTASLMRGQHPAILETLSAHSTVHSRLETLVRQNEQQRIILGELFAGFGAGPSLPLSNASSTSPSTGMSSGRTPSDFGMSLSSGGSIHRHEQGVGQTSLERQLQVTARENESLRRENDALKREIDRLRRVAAVSAVGSGSGFGAQG
ncbi:hypothetical protein CPC16_000423 [Podila verticillata]|nr:hypothetical protein CPC16_000423 [Podila verticillata]